MSTPNLESRLRSYYETVSPDDSTRLVMASAKLLDDARAAHHGRSLGAALRLAGTMVGAAIVFAVLVMARFSGGMQGPVAGSSSPGQTFDASAALSAQVDMDGAIRAGGIWAIQGSYLLASTDNGATWRAGSFPASTGFKAFETAYVLDGDHAWALTSNQPTNGTQSPPLPGTVSRTSDGGKTWLSAPVSVGFACARASMSFVDAKRGFLMCAVPSTPGPSGNLAQSLLSAKEGSGTVLATTDGGATWSVAGSAPGLSEDFTASDANTLWSVPDTISSELTGAQLYVSRNGGATWSAVDLPGLSSVPANTSIGVQAGPVFWDASNGAIAIGVDQCCSIDTIAIWFYRTSDGGRSWSVVKQPRHYPLDALMNDNASVGRVWAVVGDGGFFKMTVSSDFGASWTTVPGYGMPDNTSFLTVDLADRAHGFATVFAPQGPRVLMLTSDGGRTWHHADFGDARAKLGSNSGDPIQASNLAGSYAVMSDKDPPTAWNMLSAYSQGAFGSEPAFVTAQAGLGQRTNYNYQLGTPTQGANVLSLQNLGPGLWANLTATADMTRAYVVVESFPGTSEPTESLVLAPLSATGEWRIWVASNATTSAPSPTIGRDEAIRLATVASGYADPLVGPVELKADGGPSWPGHMVWSVQFNERAGASSGAAIVYVDANTGEARIVARG